MPRQSAPLVHLARLVVVAKLELLRSFQRLYSRLRRSAELEQNRSPLAEAELSEALQRRVAERITWFRSKLRRYPYWMNGHLELCELAFAVRSIELAYGSALAVLQLTSARGPRGRALRTLGRCHLSRSDGRKALESFEQARQVGGADPALLEDLAAAHMLLESYDEARARLEEIGAGALSAHGRSVLEWLQRREANGPSPL